MICNMYKIKKHIKNLVLFMLIFLLLGCSERTNLKAKKRNMKSIVSKKQKFLTTIS